MGWTICWHVPHWQSSWSICSECWGSQSTGECGEFVCLCRVIISLVYLVFQDHINVKEPRNSEEPRNSDIHSLNPSTSVQCTLVGDGGLHVVATPPPKVWSVDSVHVCLWTNLGSKGLNVEWSCMWFCLASYMPILGDNTGCGRFISPSDICPAMSCPVCFL